MCNEMHHMLYCVQLEYRKKVNMYPIFHLIVPTFATKYYTCVSQSFMEGNSDC